LKIPPLTAALPPDAKSECRFYEVPEKEIDGGRMYRCIFEWLNSGRCTVTMTEHKAAATPKGNSVLWRQTSGYFTTPAEKEY